ncbi:MAG: hypothetical protein INF91_07155 [Alphaproteobacteria bacterium]|nr:hypothetical protein [Alphaproteobacteria bacterium]
MASPIVVKALITRADRLNAKEAPDVAPGRVRFLVEATVQAALQAPGAIPAKISYLWEAPLDARGKAPKVKNIPVISFLRPVPGRPGQYQLAAGRAQIAATPGVESMLRRIVSEARTPAARDLRVTGIANAFHVPGSIPGESESQIFVKTAGGQPISLVVLTRPGQAKTVSYATGDIIDDAATAIPRDTMLWYRLACGLPAALPDLAVADLAPADRAAAKADYRAVLASLGPCGRTQP